MPLHACLTICPWSGPAAAFPFDSLLSVLMTCALLLRAVVGLLSSLQACKRSSFIHSIPGTRVARVVGGAKSTPWAAGTRIAHAPSHVLHACSPQQDRPVPCLVEAPVVWALASGHVHLAALLVAVVEDGNALCPMHAAAPGHV
jgi:hypothetical protein